MRREGPLAMCTVAELARHIADSIDLSDVLRKRFIDCDFCTIDEENVNYTCNKSGKNAKYSLQSAKVRAEMWYGIKAVDTGFNSTDLVLVADYYGGGSPAMAQIWTGMDTYEGVAELVQKTILDTLNVQLTANADTMLLAEFLEKPEAKRYTCRLSALKYGEVYVTAESEKEAEEKAATLFEGDSVKWHSGELTDITVEEVKEDV